MGGYCKVVKPHRGFSCFAIWIFRMYCFVYIRNHSPYMTKNKKPNDRYGSSRHALKCDKNNRYFGNKHVLKYDLKILSRTNFVIYLIICLNYLFTFWEHFWTTCPATFSFFLFISRVFLRVVGLHLGRITFIANYFIFRGVFEIFSNWSFA